MLYLILLAVVFVILFVLALMAYFNTSVSFVKNIRKLFGEEPQPGWAEEMEQRMKATSVGASLPNLGELLQERRRDKLEKAILCAEQWKHREAIEYFQSCFEPDMPKLQAAALHMLIGISFLQTDLLEEAVSHFRQALEGSRAIGFRKGEGDALTNLGLLAFNKRDFKTAEETQRRALKIHRETGDREGEATSLGNLGLVYRDLHELGKAETLHHEALAIWGELQDRVRESHQLGNLGLLFEQQARELLKEGDRNQAREKLAATERNFLEALRVARESGDRGSEGVALNNIGDLYRWLGVLEGNPAYLDKAHTHMEAALRVQRQIGNRFREAAALANLGIIASHQDQPEEACMWLRESAALYEEIGTSGEGPDLVRAKLEELGCDEEAQEPPANEDVPTG